MPDLDLHFDGLQLSISLVNRVVEEAGEPYLDWLECDASVSVPSFSGQFRWSVMPQELRRFADQLAGLYEQWPRGGSVELEPLEPNVRLVLSMDSTGRISGQYRLQAQLADGAILYGNFDLDQSYIPGLVQQLRSFVSDAVGAA